MPSPGGGRETEDTLTPTTPEAFEATVDAYRRVFRGEGVAEAFGHVVAVVVQPGVEFSGTAIHTYDDRRAAPLMAALEKHPGLCFEGPSTDYQPAASLSAMPRDGVRILKVGPELTFALREALFGLSFIEDTLLPVGARSGFRQALEAAMLAEPGHWQQHYHGIPGEQALARQYSLSDRCRYYLSTPGVTVALERRLQNLSSVSSPWGLLRQFLPGSCPAVPGAPVPGPQALIESHLNAAVLDRYLDVAAI